MAKRIAAAASAQSLRPRTQALVGTLEIAFDEIAALRNHESGPWVSALEEKVLASTIGLSGRGGAGADSVQVAVSALRACFRELRGQLR